MWRAGRPLECGPVDTSVAPRAESMRLRSFGERGTTHPLLRHMGAEEEREDLWYQLLESVTLVETRHQQGLLSLDAE